MRQALCYVLVKLVKATLHIRLINIWMSEQKIWDSNVWRRRGTVEQWLVEQCLRLWDPDAGSLGSIHGQGTRFHMLRLKPGVAK